MSVVDTTGAAYPAMPELDAVRGAARHRARRRWRHPGAGHPRRQRSDTGGPRPLPGDQGVTENRPLKLEITYAGETGEITLDI